MKKFIGFVIVCLVLSVPSAYAAVEFTGTEKGLTATARVEGMFNAMRVLAITVKNGSAKKIAVPYTLTDYTVILKDGRRFDLGRPKAAFFPANDAIRPGSTAILRPRLEDLQAGEDDIETIICSFNLGETKLRLTKRTTIVPAAPPAPIVSLKPAEPPQAAAVPAVVKKISPKTPAKKNFTHRDRKHR